MYMLIQRHVRMPVELAYAFYAFVGYLNGKECKPRFSNKCLKGT